jgi:hypothetical protein
MTKTQALLNVHAIRVIGVDLPKREIQTTAVKTTVSTRFLLLRERDRAQNFNFDQE